MVAVVALLALLAVAAGAPTVTAQENETANTTANTTVETGPYTLEELRDRGVRGSETAPPSVRRYGDGQLWLRYALTGLGSSAGNPATYNYLSSGTTVKRDEVYLGGFLGWDTTTELDVELVYWQKGQVRVEDEEGNVRYEPAAVNQTVEETSVTLSGGYDRESIDLLTSYDELERVTMFVSGPDGDATWRFNIKTSVLAQPVSIDTRSDLALWGLGFVLLMLVLTLALMKLAHRLHERAGKGPGYPIWLYIAGAFPIGFLTFVLGYQQVLSTVAEAPWILIPLVALFATIAAINWWGDDTESVGVVHVDMTSPQAHEDGSGDIPVRVESYEVAEVDGVRGLVVDGITPYLARARGAIPELSLFCGGEERTEDPSLRFPGRGSYDTIYFADPFESDPTTVKREGWSLSHLYEPPETDPDAGAVDQIVDQLTAVAWERLIPAAGILAAGWLLGGLLVASSAIGLLVSAIPAAMYAGQPVKGFAEWHLAPASYGSVLVALVDAKEEFDEVADRDYFRQKYHEEMGKNAAEHKRQTEESELSRFEQVMEELNGDVPEDLDSELTQDSAQQARTEAASDD
ncbi:hypothetical protein [Halolamina salina]|uniref:hypothetical protein n=1 Tax=Halolamina salina TaxID=1220023 RepID=UPI0036D342C1